MSKVKCRTPARHPAILVARRAGCPLRHLAFERLEDRSLLSVSFANLGYTNPFPAATHLGQPSQTTPNIFTDSFGDQSDPSGWANTGVLNDNYWPGTTAVTRSLPAWLSGSSGVTQLSVEFWLRIEPVPTSGGQTSSAFRALWLVRIGNGKARQPAKW